MKEFKTYSEQLELLKSRGIIVEDVDFALKKLKEENYFNIINGYKDLFLDKNSVEERYIENVKFEEIYALYDFDRVLRNILFKPILKVESILRSLIAYNFSEKYGQDNYLKFSNFEFYDSNFYNKEMVDNRAMMIQKLLANLQSDIASSVSKKAYINHYVVNYGFVPLWVLVNAITIGRLSQFYTLMKQSERVKIAQYWNVQEKDLKQYIKLLAFYRNLCAHDERIFNSSLDDFFINDTIYHEKIDVEKKDGRYIKGKNDLFALVIVLKILLPDDDFVNLTNKLYGRMKSLSLKINSIDPNIIFESMGFPKHWNKIKES